MISGIVLLIALVASSPPGSGLAVVVITPLVLVLAVVNAAHFQKRLSRAPAEPSTPESIGSEADLHVVNLEGLAEIDIREVSEQRLFGPSEIELDIESITQCLTGARVLVTGASGAIGAELSRQIDAFKPAQLIMLDEFPNNQAPTSRNGARERVVVVADIRDRQRVNDVFADALPDVVFHVASSQNAQVENENPQAAWNTNVLGINNVLSAAASNGVTRFVNVSNGRAFQPASVIAYTENLAEQLTTWYANRSQGAWVSVRLSSLIDTTDQFVDTLRAQLGQDRPIEVSHPEKTTAITTRREVCELVIQAGATGTRCEVFLLDVGRQARIALVAKRLAQASGDSISVVYTGLRKGEPLHEVAKPRTTIEVRRLHPQISHVLVPALTPAKLGLFDTSGTEASLASLRALCKAQPDSSLP